MQFNEIYDKTKYAFEHDEVYALLTGKDNYNYQAPMYPVSLPTCIEFVLRDGIYPLYRESKDQKIIEDYCEALMHMIKSDDAVAVWWATSILYMQKINETAEWMKNNAPFEITSDFWNELGQILPKHKIALMKNFDYQGNGEEYGLWSDILRINRLLLKKYAVRMIEEN